MATNSLWPDDLFVEKLVAPITILREQANYLSAASGRDILGNIVTRRADGSGWPPSEDERGIVHHFQLVVPSMGDYAFELFEARHEPRALYPVFITFHLGDSYDRQNELKADDRKELERVLKVIFEDDGTKAVVRTLKAQTEDPDTRPPELEAEGREGHEVTAEDDDIPF